MKTTFIYLITGAIAVMILHGCGPSEEELREQERARQQAINDSLALVYEAQLEQMRLDSLEQVRQDSIEEAEAKPNIVYSETGHFVVQIEAWRSESKAERQANTWKNKGYENVFITQLGSIESGDLWYRVRIGRFDTRDMARNLQQQLQEDYGLESWVANYSE